MRLELDSEISNFILNQMSAGIALFDAETLQMIWCNGSFRKQTWFGTAQQGRKANEVALQDLFMPNDHNAVLQLVRIAIEQGYSYDSERSIRRGKLRTFPAELKLYRVDNDSSGRPAFGFEFIDLSITKLYEELQKREEELRKTQADLVQASKMASLGEMAGGVAHEINNPLAIIRGRSELIEKILLRGDFSRIDNIKSMIRNVIDTTDRIATIIRGLKNFAYGGGEGEFKDSSVKLIVEDTLALCKERFRSNCVTITVNDFEDSLGITCQPVQISQVLLNLLNNAFDAAIKQADKWVKIHVSNHDGRVAITVTDSGLGIPRNIQNRIMEPFFTTKEIGAGTGLGLSISKGIINAHNGELRLDVSAPNTTFVIDLPCPQKATNSEKDVKIAS